jgi:glutathione S-transferase
VAASLNRNKHQNSVICAEGLKLKLLIGNRNFSSWSLRAWLIVEYSGLPCDVELIPLNQPETRTRLRAASPSAKVPVLVDKTIVVWDSLAIAEYIAEQAPNAGIWPTDSVARATARSLCAEMHSGFTLLRENLPMDLTGSSPHAAVETPALRVEVDRILDIWSGRFDSGRGEFLFGGFGAVDAFFTPVATRFRTYGIKLSGEAARYASALLSWPAYRRWTAEAEREMETVRHSARGVG